MNSINIRPRFVIQLAVLATVSVTLWLTFDSASLAPPPSSFPSSPSLSNAVPPIPVPVLLEAKPRSRTSSAIATSSTPWQYTKPKEELEPCDKIFLFSFLPWWGFASEFILYIRARSMADKLGYTFLADDSAWNYGRLASYFAPLPLSCVPPADWNDYRKAYPIHQGQSWRYDKKGRPRRRLRYSRAFLSNLDDWTRDTYFDSTGSTAEELEELRINDERHRVEKDRWILEQGATLPRVFEGVFGEHADAVNGSWRLSREMQEEVGELAERAGLRVPRQLESVDSGRGPVIGLHIRLGDKATEFAHDADEMGIANTFGNLTVYIEAAHDAYRRLVPGDYPSLSDDVDPTPRFSPTARPTLLLMTAEPGVAEQLAQIPLAKGFNIVQTPAASGSGPQKGDFGSTRAKGGGTERPQAAGPKAYSMSTGGNSGLSALNSTDLRDGYTQSAFNSMPLDERIEHTKSFVRDLSLLTSSEIDALVVSGASNIGRLAMLIGGVQAVIGPRNLNGHSLGGKIRSIDAHFYPTSYPSSVYTRLKDLEDLENAAVLPEEQLRRPNRKTTVQQKRKQK